MYLACPLSLETVDMGFRWECLWKGQKCVKLHPIVCSLCMFFFEQFLHTCLHLVDQVLHASWAAPSRSCMSARLHLPNTACQLGCTYQSWQQACHTTKPEWVLSRCSCSVWQVTWVSIVPICVPAWLHLATPAWHPGDTVLRYVRAAAITWI